MMSYEKILLGVFTSLVVAGVILLSHVVTAQTACPTGSMIVSDSGATSCGVVPGLTIGTTTTGSPGSSALVTNTGTGPQPVLNFTIPSGLTGSAGSNGTNGAAGIVCYNSSGVISGCKQWVGTATVNSSGNWSVSIASAGFSSVGWTQFASIAPANGGSVSIATGSCTATTCSGTATGALNVLGVLTLSLSNISGSVISVQAVGQ